MPKISVIIPVYNNAQYLHQCMDSVINQTEKDLEIICVDDKSTDDSLQILKDYAKKDNRIVVIESNENNGVSHARNKALEKMTGEYTCFLDSDDFLEPISCKYLVNDMINNNTDLSCGGHCKVNKFERKISTWLPERIVSTNLFEDINKLTKHRNVTQKMFKSEIIKSNNITFNTSLHYMEDALFLITYLTYCKSISGARQMLYNVRINENSLCRSAEFVERRKIESENARRYIDNVILNYRQSK